MADDNPQPTLQDYYHDQYKPLKQHIITKITPVVKTIYDKITYFYSSKEMNMYTKDPTCNPFEGATAPSTANTSVEKNLDWVLTTKIIKTKLLAARMNTLHPLNEERRTYINDLRESIQNEAGNGNFEIIIDDIVNVDDKNFIISALVTSGYVITRTSDNKLCISWEHPEYNYTTWKSPPKENNSVPEDTTPEDTTPE